MTLRDNTLLRFSERRCSSEALEELKRFYETEINSKRCYDSIGSLEGLLSILHRRDVLNDDTKVDILETISNIIDQIDGRKIRQAVNCSNRDGNVLFRGIECMSRFV